LDNAYCKAVYQTFSYPISIEELFLPLRAAAGMSHSAAALEEAILIQHYIKAGAVFLDSTRQPLPFTKATTNERRMMMKNKLFQEPARARVFLRAGSFRE